MIKDGSHSLSGDGNRVQKKKKKRRYIICNLITISTNYLEDIEKYWTCLVQFFCNADAWKIHELSSQKE